MIKSILEKWKILRSNTLMVSLLSSLPVIILPAINFLLLPLYLKLLHPADFAVYNLLSNLSGLFAILIGLKIGNAILPYFNEYNTDEKTIHWFIVSIVKYILWFSLITLGVTAVLGPFIFRLIFKSGIFNFYPDGIMVVLIGIAAALELVAIIFLRNKKRFFLLAKIQMVAIAVSVLLQVLLLFFFSATATSLLIARTISVVILPFYFLFHYLKPYWYLPIKKDFIKKSLAFTKPLLIWLILSWFIFSFDRYYFEWILANNLVLLGSYILLVTLIAPISMVGDAIINSIQPYIYEQFYLQQQKGLKMVNQYFTIYIYLLLLFSSFIMLIGTNINFITSKKEYYNIIIFIPLATLTHLFQGYSYIFRTTLIFRKKSKQISVVSIFNLFILLAFYFFLIPHFFIWGAISALIIDGIFSAGSFYYLAIKSKTIHFDILSIVIIPGIIYVMVLLSFYYFQQESWFHNSYWGVLQFMVIGGLFLYQLKQFNTAGKQLN